MLPIDDVFDDFQQEFSQVSIDDLCASAGVPSVATALKTASVTPMALISLMASSKQDFLDGLSVQPGIWSLDVHVLFGYLNVRFKARLCAAGHGPGAASSSDAAPAADKVESSNLFQKMQQELDDIKSGGETSSESSLFLKGLMTNLGPDDLKNKSKLAKLLKAAKAGQAGQESEIGSFLSLLSGKGDDAGSCDFASLGESKRASFKARVRKSYRDFARLNRAIRDVMASQTFMNAAGDRDFHQLDRWTKLTDYVIKLESRHSWKVASEFMVEFLDMHDFELILSPDTGLDSYTIHLPELLD